MSWLPLAPCTSGRESWLFLHPLHCHGLPPAPSVLEEAWDSKTQYKVLQKQLDLHGWQLKTGCGEILFMYFWPYPCTHNCSTAVQSASGHTYQHRTRPRTSVKCISGLADGTVSQCQQPAQEVPAHTHAQRSVSSTLNVVKWER